jgi:hypothetical protein
MPRAKIDLGEKWEATFSAKLSPAVVARVRAEPQTERELSEFALSSANAKELAANLKRIYSLQFSRHISGKTAFSTIERAVMRALTAAKRKFPAEFQISRNSVQIGRGERHGKLRKLYLSSKENSLGKEVLLSLDKRNFLPIDSIPYSRKHIDQSIAPLLEFGAVESRISSKGPFLALPGRPVDDEAAVRKSGKFPLTEAKKLFPNCRLTENFRASRWIVGTGGLAERRISFPLVAFDSAARAVHLCDSSGKQTGPAALREFRERASDLAVPAFLHFFAPSFSKESEEYARKHGISLHLVKNAP